MVLTFPAAYHNSDVIFLAYGVYCCVVVNNFLLLLSMHNLSPIISAAR